MTSDWRNPHLERHNTLYIFSQEYYSLWWLNWTWWSAPKQLILYNFDILTFFKGSTQLSFQLSKGHLSIMETFCVDSYLPTDHLAWDDFPIDAAEAPNQNWTPHPSRLLRWPRGSKTSQYKIPALNPQILEYRWGLKQNKPTDTPTLPLTHSPLSHF